MSNSSLLRGLAVAAVCALASGCGTFANTCWLTPEEGGMRAYGGTRADWQVAREAAANSDYHERVACLVKCALDLPLSALGDTITLPLILWHIVNGTNKPGPIESTSTQRLQPSRQALPSAK